MAGYNVTTATENSFGRGTGLLVPTDTFLPSGSVLEREFHVPSTI